MSSDSMKTAVATNRGKSFLTESLERFGWRELFAPQRLVPDAADQREETPGLKEYFARSF